MPAVVFLKTTTLPVLLLLLLFLLLPLSTSRTMGHQGARPEQTRRGRADPGPSERQVMTDVVQSLVVVEISDKR